MSLRPPARHWFKSSRSLSQSNCLEMAVSHDGRVLLRDSKNPDGGTLTYSASAWLDFLADIKSGALGRRRNAPADSD